MENQPFTNKASPPRFPPPHAVISVFQSNLRRKALRYLGHTGQTGPEQESMMTKQRRWMKSAIATSTEVRVALPWARTTRRRPEAMKPVQAQPLRALAAR